MNNIALQPSAGDFGYTAALQAELDRIGPITPEEFARRYALPADRYLPGLSWDPTTARYWEVYSHDPHEVFAEQVIERLEALLPPQPRKIPAVSDTALDELFALMDVWEQAQAAENQARQQAQQLEKVYQQAQGSDRETIRSEYEQHYREAGRLYQLAQEEQGRVEQYAAAYHPLISLIGKWFDWDRTIFSKLRGRSFKTGADLLAWLMQERGPRERIDHNLLQQWNEWMPMPLMREQRLRVLHRLLTGHYGLHADFRLNPAECALFRQNGFVVTQRLGAPSFGDLYYHLFNNDLPVFITADSLLHAWHHSFDQMLIELEENCLMALLDDILSAMAACLPAAERDYGQGILAESVRDADYFLAVARALLAGNPIAEQPIQKADCDTEAIVSAGHFGQQERILETLRACAEEQMQEFPLFGCIRVVDFSQFKPRGHYEKSEKLRRYFKAMIWCGRIDLRVAGGDDPAETTQRQLGGALVLLDLLKRAGKLEAWQQFDRLLQTFVGRADSLSFAQLDAFLQSSELRSPADITRWSDLEYLQADILASDLGYQQITSDYFVSEPFGTQQTKLPRSFTLMGQKFTLDSWALGQVVFDKVLWDKGKVWRRIPSCLDVAFAALGNDHVVPDLVARIRDQEGRQYRDGLPYQHQLAALREVIDARDEASWETSLYTQWLACLRALSEPAISAEYPQACRTRAWALKSLNTQLASWTQLRHDTILYVKQSYTAGTVCHYPAGYVEPNRQFWQRLRKMASDAADLLAQTPFSQLKVEEERHPADIFDGFGSAPSPQEILNKQVAFLRHFAAQAGILECIAQKQTAQQELTSEETKFLQDVVQIVDVVGSGGGRYYNGWYPSLFYAGREKCAESDLLVADVHTDTPSDTPPDPGCVLHQGVGSVDLLVVAIDNGEDRLVYAGPTISHYEFEMPGVTRKSDSQWKMDLQAGRCPDRPVWTQGYLVPAQEQPRVQLVPRIGR